MASPHSFSSAKQNYKSCPLQSLCYDSSFVTIFWQLQDNDSKNLASRQLTKNSEVWALPQTYKIEINSALGRKRRRDSKLQYIYWSSQEFENHYIDTWAFAIFICHTWYPEIMLRILIAPHHPECYYFASCEINIQGL